MKTALLQCSLVWENPQANRDYFSDKINAIQEKVDLIVLPEMFSTGFTMNPETVAEKMQGDTVLWMQMMAQNKSCAIMGSLIIIEDEKFFNRLLFVYPSGTIQTYDKKHLFTLAGESKVYTAGTEKLIIDYNGWKICALVCYDLRFPVFSRNVEDYDLLVYVANWPKARINAWDTLLKARAIENMSYVIGVNRVGEDGNGHEYLGHSQIIDPLGNDIVELSETEVVLIAEIDKDKINEWREKFAFLNDRDSFKISN
jgi:omega-amidase